MTVKNITSRANPLIKETVRLEDKKHREELGKFCFEGRKLLSEALSENIPIEYIMFTERALNDEKIRPLLEKASQRAEMYLVTDDVYGKISYEKSPEGVFCVSKALDKFHNLYIIYKGSDLNCRTVILDGVRDPGNLGTVLRTASAFGIENVILSSDCADVYNSKAIRASMGAVFRIKTLRVENMPQTVAELRKGGVKVYSAALSENAVSLIDVKEAHKAIFIIGNEGSGIRENVINSTDGCVIIPMDTGTESLNAASAATVILWEQYRQSKINFKE